MDSLTVFGLELNSPDAHVEVLTPQHSVVKKTWVRSLILGDPTGSRATEPANHTMEPVLQNQEPELPSPRATTAEVTP